MVGNLIKKRIPLGFVGLPLFLSGAEKLLTDAGRCGLVDPYRCSITGSGVSRSFSPDKVSILWVPQPFFWMWRIMSAVRWGLMLLNQWFDSCMIDRPHREHKFTKLVLFWKHRCIRRMYGGKSGETQTGTWSGLWVIIDLINGVEWSVSWEKQQGPQNQKGNMSSTTKAARSGKKPEQHDQRQTKISLTRKMGCPFRFTLSSN